jgi:hypothetical protein
MGFFQNEDIQDGVFLRIWRPALSFETYYINMVAAGFF